MLKILIIVTIYCSGLFSYDLIVKVKDLRNSKGVAQFSLYNKDGSIPDQKFTKYFKQKKVKIVDKSAIVTFYNLPKGNYAVGFLDDENQNGKIDKGFILPIEGIGFTKFNTINLAHKPNFKDASLFLDKNITISIKVIYF